MQMPSPVSSASPSRQRLTALGALFPAKVALASQQQATPPGPLQLQIEGSRLASMP
jgi:hypothetical protein